MKVTSVKMRVAGKLPPIKLSLLVNSSRKTPAQKTATRTILTHVFKHSHQVFLIPFSLLPPLSLRLLKKLFVILYSKSQTYCAVFKKIVACRSKLLHTQKSFAGQGCSSITIVSIRLFWNFLSWKLRNVMLLNSINLV